MNSPNPVPPQSGGWTPTTSTLGGAVFGGAVAQLIIAMIESISHQVLSSATAAALTTVVVGVVGYAFPDGGRK